MMKRMLAVFFMAMVISVCLVSADADADETLPEENVVYGSDYQVVYGENTLYAPITTFVVGWEYHDVFIGYGKDPQDALPGMTSYSEEIDGMDMMFMSGTPTSWCGILIPFTAGESVMYVNVESVPVSEYEYGADPTISGTTYTMQLGEYYHYSLGPGTDVVTIQEMNAPVNYLGLDVWNEIVGGIPWVRISGTANNVGTFTLQVEQGYSAVKTYTFIVEGDPILVTKINVTGEDHMYDSPIQFTATVTPSDATDKTMSCYMSRGGSYATINKSSVVSGSPVTMTRQTSDAQSVTCMFRSESGSGNVYLAWNCWTEKKCTAQLSFSANGGSGEPSTMTEYKWTSACNIYGQASFTIPSTTPVWSGHIFKGWSTSPTSSSASYTAGKTYYISYSTSSTQTKTLYAVWETIVLPTSISITSYSSGLTLGTADSARDVYVYVSPSNASVKTVSVRSGYDTSVCSVTRSPAASGSMTHIYVTPVGIGSTTITLYADGDSGVTATLPVTVKQTMTGTCRFMNGNTVFATETENSTTGTFYYDIPESNPVPAAGKSFVGWCKDSAGTGTIYTNADYHITSTNPNETLYAIFSNQYTLKFADTGSTTVADIVIKSTEGSCTFTLPSTICTGKTGYTFVGWSQNQNSTEAQFLPSSSYPVNAGSNGNTFTLYGAWEPQSYKVNFVTDGSPVSQRTVTYGQTYGVLGTSLKTGYDFVGWFTAENGGTQVTSDTVVTATGNHSLYAHWTAKVFSVSFVTGIDTSIPNMTVTYGQTYGSASGWPSTDPSKTDYVFLGWFTAAEDGNKISSDTVVSATSNHTLYAHWKERTDCTVEFIDGNVSSQITQKVGDMIELKTPDSRVGYTFTGWYTLPTGGTLVGYGGADYVLEENITLYAHWTAMTITVMFNSNGGSHVASQSAVFGQKFGDLPVPTKSGFDFDGWMLNDVIVTKDSIVNSVSPVLEAQWVIHVDRFTVTYYNSVQERLVIGQELVRTGDPITMTAGIPQDGMKWVKWVTLNGDTVSNYDMDAPVSADLNLYGVYVAVEKPTGTLTVGSIEVNGRTYTTIKVEADDADSILWDFGDGSEPQEHDAGLINKRYSAGEYTIKITLTNEGGSTILEETIKVTDTGGITVVRSNITPMIIAGVFMAMMLLIIVVPRVI